jgi:hypothetical protein
MPECGANPCTNSSLPVNGNHACSICKVELHGPCGVFFLDESIKYQNICHVCKKTVQCAVNASERRSSYQSATSKTSTTSSQTILASGSQEISNLANSRDTSLVAIGSSTQDTLLVAIASSEEVNTKQAEKSVIKTIDLKNIAWWDITVGEIPSQRAQDKGMMVKSVIKIAGYTAEYFTADQIWQICAGLKLTGYRSKSKDEALRIIAISKIHADCYEYAGISNDKPSGDKPPAKTKNCIFLVGQCPIFR